MNDEENRELAEGKEDQIITIRGFNRSSSLGQSEWRITLFISRTDQKDERAWEMKRRFLHSFIPSHHLSHVSHRLANFNWEKDRQNKSFPNERKLTSFFWSRAFWTRVSSNRSFVSDNWFFRDRTWEKRAVIADSRVFLIMKKWDISHLNF